MKIKKILVYLITMFVHLSLHAQLAFLDPTFGFHGRVHNDFSGRIDDITAIAIQPDGKIVAVGSIYEYFGLARYNTDGSLDTTFGTAGEVTTLIGDYCVINSIIIQPDGKIVAAGYCIHSGYYYFAIARYNDDGTLDHTFSVDGIVMTAYDYINSEDAIYSAALQDDGKLVVAGFSYAYGGSSGIALARYNTNGSLDTTFGASAITREYFLGGGCAYGVAIQSDGKIVIAADNYSDFIAARFNSNGTFDPTFNYTGIASADLGKTEESRFIIIQPDSKIIVGGPSYTRAPTAINYEYDFAMTRYNNDGSLDTTFGSRGKVITPFEGGIGIANAIALQTDGKIVMAGAKYNCNNYDFIVVRYNSDGTLDNTYGTRGKFTTDFEGGDDYANAIAIQSDGKIVAAGVKDYNEYAESDFAIVRYKISSTCTTHFGSLHETICNGDSLKTCNKTYKTMGTYSDTLTSVIGCDSILAIHLTVIPSYASTQTLTICEGQSITVGTVTHEISGIYNDTLTSIHGCDSIMTTNLTVSPSNYFHTVTVCEGESITIGIHTYNANGMYVDSLISNTGCDSIITTTLEVLPLNFSQSFNICYGQHISVGTHTYDSTGTYIDSITSSHGCDSILVTNLTVQSADTFLQADTICSGHNIFVGIHTYNLQGIYTDTLLSYTGCDSTVTTNLTVLPLNTIDQTFTICEGQDIIVGTHSYTLSGSYIDTLISFHSCDSIITTNLITISSVHYSTDYDSTSNTFTITVDSATTALATSYNWNFGDGTSSTLPTPTHIYAIDSLYNVCMKVFYADGDSCTYCHVIGIDSAGNIIRDAGFTLDIKNANSLPTSVTQNTATDISITIYPNPNTGIFQLTIDNGQLKSNGQLSIYNLVGEKIYYKDCKQINNVTTIDLSDQPNGIYFMQLKTEKNTVTKKIIINK